MKFHEFINKVRKDKWVFRSIFKTIWFNFHFLPFKQAIKLPIWLYKPKFGKLTGSIEIKSPVKPGMVRLGFYCVGLYPNSGIFLNVEGKIVFENTALIGNNSFIHIGKKGELSFGNKVSATSTFRLSCCVKTIFEDYVRFGWDCLVTDSDFHRMRCADGSYTKGYSPIVIGEGTWIANGCKMLKGTTLPAYCTISSGTVLSGKIDVEPYSVLGQSKDVVVFSTGKWLDPFDNDIVELL